MARRVTRFSWRREGPVARAATKALRAGVVVLRPGGVMARHSTGEREELLIVLSGRVRLEADALPACPPPRLPAGRHGLPALRRLSGQAGPWRGRRARLVLSEGSGAFLPPRTWHRVVNPVSARAHGVTHHRVSARYLYVTAKPH